MSGAAGRLAAKLELAAPVYAAAAARLWASDRVRELYPVYLATMHMVARASVPLLRAGRVRTRALAGRDPVAAGLDEPLRVALGERLGLATALLDDLEASGIDRGLPDAAIPSPAVARLVGALAYWVDHHHPAALLGYLAALEQLPPSPGFTADLAARTGLPAPAFAHLRARERAGARSLDLDRLGLTARDEGLIGLAALHTVDAGIDVLAEIHARVFERPCG